MDLSIQTVQTIQLDDKPWIDSVKGTPTIRTITVLPSLGFVAGTHIVDGFLLSGCPIGRVTSGGNAGVWGLYDDTATDGRQTCRGFLFGREKVSAGGATVKIGAAWMWEGVVRLSRLPVTLDAAGQADLEAKFLLVP